MFLSAAVVAANLQDDDTAGLLLWVKGFWWMFVVEAVSLMASIFLCLFSIYYCAKIKYPTVIMDKDLLFRVSAYGFVALWCLMIFWTVFVQLRRVIPHVRETYDDTTGSRMEVVGQRCQGSLPASAGGGRTRAQRQQQHPFVLPLIRRPSLF